jgi:hypothetical protein
MKLLMIPKIKKILKAFGKAEIIHIFEQDADPDDCTNWEVNWIGEIENDPENELLCVNVENDDNVYPLTFDEKGIATAEYTDNDNCLIMSDVRDIKWEISLWKTVPVKI